MRERVALSQQPHPLAEAKNSSRDRSDGVVFLRAPCHGHRMFPPSHILTPDNITTPQGGVLPYGHVGEGRTDPWTWGTAATVSSR